MTPQKPLIGIVSKVIDIKFHGWTSNDISNNIRYALVKNGARAIGILPPQQIIFPTIDKNGENDIDLSAEEEKDLISTLELCNGLILEGGISSYKYEKFIAQYARKNNIPILGICAGMNVLTRSAKGTTKFIEPKGIHQKPELKYAHNLKIEKDSKLFSIIGQTEIAVNSIHNHVPDILGDYRAVGYADDGFIEAIEMPENDFNLGIKFHPELLVDEDENMNAIFQAFISASQKKL